jgi:cholesterol oxidase
VIFAVWLVSLGGLQTPPITWIRSCMNRHWDWIVVGSGFGGSVSALRLAQKGYSVLLLEKGRRFQAKDFPKSNWNLRRWLWAPKVGFKGSFQMTFLRHLTSLNGVGVGGGSLVYANTLPTPKGEFFSAPAWGHLAKWEEELGPHYHTARTMLGAVENPDSTPADEALMAVAKEMHREGFLHPTQVAVFFGEPDQEVPDPFFGGEGPSRTGCNRCGGCMTGCRYGAKNTLDLNYLWLAEGMGAEIRAQSEVQWVRPLVGDSSGFEITFKEQSSTFGQTIRRVTARRVVLAAGVLGTVELLLRLKEGRDGLPALSPMVGDRVRTNSEVLVAVTTERRDLDLSQGVSITSILETDAHSSVEPVRFRSGSGFFRLLGLPHAPGSTVLRRLGNALAGAARHPIRTLRWVTVPDWAKYTTVLLYMRTQEGYLRLRLGRSIRTLFRLGLISEPGEGPTPTAAIPEATELAERFADQIQGTPGSLITETLFGTPTTAHILGGAVMGSTPHEGVIDHRHRVFGYPDILVVDGSAVSANLGVNPALTISALAERAMSFIEPKEGYPASENPNE